MRFRLGLRTRLAGPGDVVEVAPGVAHSFANPGTERPASASRSAPP
jgi:mannose-6-phosphate isomerase-like protein (cupin superfamily)